MADKIILSITGTGLVQSALPSSIHRLLTLNGSATLYPSTSRYATAGSITTIFGYPEANYNQSNNWGVNNTQSTVGTDKPYLSYRICPSASTSITDGYFVDLSMINIEGLSQTSTFISNSPNSLLLTYSNTSENTITINSIAQFVTNDVYYNGTYTKYTPKQIVADNTKWNMITVTSLVVLENPLVLEPGDVKTITINYDYSNLTE